MFKEVVEKRIKDTAGKITRLIKLTDGEAKERTKRFIYLSPESG